MMIFESLYFWLTVVILLYLLSIYWIFPSMNHLNRKYIEITSSVGSAFLTAFLFLYALPASHHVFNNIEKQENHVFWKKFHIHYLIVVVFLFGFALHYTIEKITRNKINQSQEIRNFEYLSFYGTMIFWSAFHFSIMFILPYMITASLFFTSFFMIAVGYHLFLEVNSEYAYYKQNLFQYLSRSLVSLSLLGGWIAGLFFIHLQTPLIMIFIGAFIGGVLLMSMIKTEFDCHNHKRESHSFSFLLSLFLSTIIILASLWIEHHFLITAPN
jgi:hypothetical protein